MNLGFGGNLGKDFGFKNLNLGNLVGFNMGGGLSRGFGLRNIGLRNSLGFRIGRIGGSLNNGLCLKKLDF